MRQHLNCSWPVSFIRSVCPRSTHSQHLMLQHVEASASSTEFVVVVCGGGFMVATPAAAIAITLS